MHTHFRTERNRCTKEENRDEKVDREDNPWVRQTRERQCHRYENHGDEAQDGSDKGKVDLRRHRGPQARLQRRRDGEGDDSESELGCACGEKRYTDHIEDACCAWFELL